MGYKILVQHAALIVSGRSYFDQLHQRGDFYRIKRVSTVSVTMPCPCAGALTKRMLMGFSKSVVCVLLATTIAQAVAARRMLAKQEKHLTDNITKLREYYGTGTNTP